MFTLKFVRAGSLQTTSICTPRYTILEGDRTDVWIYPTLKAESPILLHLHENEDDDTYYELFVENSSGKTIDRRRAYLSHKEATEE